MPTENELKFVLRLHCEDSIRKLADDAALVHQGYLVGSKGISLRVRKSKLLRTGVEKFYMTFKYTTKERVIEVEKKLDHRDFDDLWHGCMNKLEKVRYFVSHKKLCWEIDFFKDHHTETYFAMAEHEMPEGQRHPDVIPHFISSHLLYAVPLTDTRFASKLLADVRHAKDLYQLLLKEQCNDDQAAKQVV